MAKHDPLGLGERHDLPHAILANLGALRRQRVWFVGAPLPIPGVDACPIRAFAIEPEEE